MTVWVVDHVSESMDWHATNLAVCANEEAAVGYVVGLFHKRKATYPQPTIDAKGWYHWQVNGFSEYVAREVEVVGAS
jgi:hypothetical protein